MTLSCSSSLSSNLVLQLVKARTYSRTTRQRRVVKTCPTCQCKVLLGQAAVKAAVQVMTACQWQIVKVTVQVMAGKSYCPR
jgi:hypothetical protein